MLTVFVGLLRSIGMPTEESVLADDAYASGR
jgi:hypothetical protein